MLLSKRTDQLLTNRSIQMSRLKTAFDKAVRLGLDAGAMCNVCGGTDASIATVPAARHDELAGVLERMCGDGRAVAQARADFTTLKEATRRDRAVADGGDDEADAAVDAIVGKPLRKNASGFAMPADDAPTARPFATKAADLDAAAIYARWNNPPKASA
jgi:hypothetical protein